MTDLSLGYRSLKEISVEESNTTGFEKRSTESKPTTIRDERLRMEAAVSCHVQRTHGREQHCRRGCAAVRQVHIGVLAVKHRLDALTPDNE